MSVTESDATAASAMETDYLYVDVLATANCAGAPLATIALCPASFGLSGAEGQTVTGPVAFFTDGEAPPGASFTVAIHYGDGVTSTPSGLSCFNGCVVNASHLYAEAGVYTVTTSVTDNITGSYLASTQVIETGSAVGSVTLTAPATISDQLLTAQPVAASGCVLLTPCVVTAANFSDANSTYCNQEGESISSHYTATISYGDGTTGPGTITENGTTCTFVVSGSHVYGTPGTFTVIVVIQDTGGAPAIMTSTGAGTAGSAGVIIPGSSPSGRHTYVTTYFNTFGYNMSFNTVHYATGNIIGHLFVVDTSSGLATPNCATTAAASQCKLHVTASVCTSVGQTADSYGYYTFQGLTRYFHVQAIDTDPEILHTVDTLNVWTTDIGGHVESSSHYVPVFLMEILC